MNKPKKSKSQFGRFLLKFVLWFFGITIGLTVLLRFVPVCYTPLMLKRAIEFRSDKNYKYQRDWVSFDEISRHMVLAVIASEDQKFLEHHGFDWEYIQKAHEKNQKNEKKGSPKRAGGSSITQQTAKNVFTFGTRNFFRKGVEAYYTILIEGFWSKRRIMEVYLNVAEFGKGIYGVEAAAQHYFHRPAAKLTREQAALLAAVLPKPLKYSVQNPGKYVLRQQQHILRQMSNLSYAPYDELAK